MRHSADNARENSVSGRFWWLTSYGKILVSHTTHFSFGAGHSGRMAQPRALLVAAVVMVVSVCNWYHGNICFEFVHHQKITSPLLCFALKNEINHISPCHMNKSQCLRFFLRQWNQSGTYMNGLSYLDLSWAAWRIPWAAFPFPAFPWRRRRRTEVGAGRGPSWAEAWEASRRPALARGFLPRPGHRARWSWEGWLRRRPRLPARWQRPKWLPGWPTNRWSRCA